MNERRPYSQQETEVPEVSEQIIAVWTPEDFLDALAQMTQYVGLVGEVVS